MTCRIDSLIQVIHAGSKLIGSTQQIFFKKSSPTQYPAKLHGTTVQGLLTTAPKKTAGRFSEKSHTLAKTIMVCIKRNGEKAI